MRTTISGDGSERPAALVKREFTAEAPNRLWLADLTYVKTHSGWVCVAFILDVYSPTVVGWQASRSLRADLAIDALEMAVFNRRRAGADLSGLVHHSDMGVQCLSIRYSLRLTDNGVVVFVGSKGDSCDNAMIESVNGPYKWELIHPTGLGNASRTSNSPPSNTSTGSTTNAATERSSPGAASSPPQQPTTLPTTVRTSQPTGP